MKKALLLLIYVTGFGLITVHSFMHVAKYYLLTKEFYSAPVVYKGINHFFSERDHLFITNMQLLPALGNHLTMHHDRIHILFITPRTMPELWQKDKDNFLGHALPHIPPQHQIWGVMRKQIDILNDQTICVFLDGIPTQKILLSQVTTLYQDANNFFFRPEKVVVGEEGQDCLKIN